MRQFSSATSQKYSKLVARLFNWKQGERIQLNGGVQPQFYVDLGRMKQLCAHFGNPQEQFKSVHVTGTNGKGSVSFKIGRALMAHNFRTGVYSSPEVYCFRERIMVNDEKISEEEMVEYLEEIFAYCVRDLKNASFLDMITMVNYLKMAKEKVDYCVLEAGIGGLLDQTNVVEPSTTVVTSIGLDHTHILGKTEETIAWHKCGIAKPGVPMVIGRVAPRERCLKHSLDRGASEVIFVEDQQVDEPVTFMDDNNNTSRVAFRTLAKHDAFEVDTQKLEAAIQENLRGRMELVEPQYLKSKGFRIQHVFMDCGHNLESVEILIESIKKKYPGRKLRMFCCFNLERNYDSITRLVLKSVDHFHYMHGEHRLMLPPGKAVPRITEIAREEGKEHVFQDHSQEKNLGFTLDRFLGEAAPDEVALVVGTVRLMRETRKYFGYHVDTLNIEGFD